MAQTPHRLAINNRYFSTENPLFYQPGILIKHYKGFSLVELLVVVAIIAILATVSIPAYSTYLDKSKYSRAKSELRTISTEISGYYLDKSTYPNTLADINRGGFTDPWKRIYVYNFFAANGTAPLMEIFNVNKLNSEYDLYSTGIDGLSTTAGGNWENKDDIVQFNDGVIIDLREPPNP